MIFISCDFVWLDFRRVSPSGKRDMIEKGSFHDRQEAWKKQATRITQHEGPNDLPEVIQFFQLGLPSS